MSDSAEKMREAIKRFHRNCCYPEAFDFEVDGLMNELAALSAGETKEDGQRLVPCPICGGEAIPPTAQNPNRDVYQRGKFDGVMECQRNIIKLREAARVQSEPSK